MFGKKRQAYPYFGGTSFNADRSLGTYPERNLTLKTINAQGALVNLFSLKNLLSNHSQLRYILAFSLKTIHIQL